MVLPQAQFDFRRLDQHSDADQHTRILTPVRRISQEGAFNGSLSRDLVGRAEAPAKLVEADRDHGNIPVVSPVDSFRSALAASWLLAPFARCRAAWSAAQERRVQRVIRQGLSHIE